MSRVYRTETWADDDVLLPDEPNAELNAVIGEMNGHLDTDNLDAALVTGAKVALDVFHEILWVEGAGPDAHERVNSDTQRWFALESRPLVTGDGRVFVEAQATWDFAAGDGNHVEIGVRLDGVVVARSGSSSFLEADSATAIGCPPVAPGSHTVELVMRITPGERKSPPTTSLTATVNGRSLWARFLAR